MTEVNPDRMLVVGGGLIGTALTGELRARGRCAVIACRHPPADGIACDLTEPSGLDRLRQLAGCYGGVVLVHGPSDVTWCETHEQDARAAHAGVATAMARTSARLLLVSTDNVFSGQYPRPRPGDPIAPQNAYGRAKAAAETEVLAAGGTVVRVSLVYGHRPSRSLRRNFAEECLDHALRREPLEVPVDQYFTPVHVGDVAATLASIAGRCARSGGLFHLAGPDLLSRYDMALLAYRLSGAPPALVRGVARAATRWASRPPNSSLETALPEPLVAGIQGVEAGLRSMLHSNVIRRPGDE